jgi:hypothetical protein
MRREVGRALGNGGAANELRRLMQADAWRPEDCAYIGILTAVSLLFRMLNPNAPATIGAAQ